MAIASAALIVAASLAVGQALLSLCGRREPTALAGPVGLALLLVAAGLTAGWGGRGPAIAIVLGSLTLAAAAALIVRRELLAPDPRAVGAALIAALIASIPFITAGHVGILGVGLVNDDMASHLLLADWIDERFRPEPRLVDQGYPLGPHALVAGLARALGTRSIDVFAGLVIALPALTAMVAHAALDGLRTAVRIAAAALVALPYMAVAYLAQEAFKEPLIAVFVLGFALLLASTTSRPRAVPLGVLAAGTVYVYSFPGLAWLVGTALVWGAAGLVRERRIARVWPLALVAVAVFAVLVVPDLDRLRDFADFRALHPDRANEGGLGNLPGHLSPLLALGIWPTSEFRLSASASDLPALVFYAGGLFALAALVAGVPRWRGRHGDAILAALATAALLYVAARAFGTVYTSAKALAIAAPLVALVTLGGLLATPRRWALALAAVFALAAAGSSFLVLRQAPVAPDDHMDELAQIRPLVEGEKLLFLGRDNFVLYELRGSKPFTHVRNFYDPYFVEPDPDYHVAGLGFKFDFDSVSAKTLGGFPYVLTTRAGYASGPPPSYKPIEKTDSYVLWRQDESPLGRVPGETNQEPGRMRACPKRVPDRISTFSQRPIALSASAWSQKTIENGETATIELGDAAGIEEISLQYDSTRPVTLTSPEARGFSATLPGNLDYRGAAPYWRAGAIDVPGEATHLEATVEDPPLAGRLLGAHSVAHLGGVALTRPDEPRVGPGRAPIYEGRLLYLASPNCGDYVDWYVR